MTSPMYNYSKLLLMYALAEPADHVSRPSVRGVAVLGSNGRPLGLDRRRKPTWINTLQVPRQISLLKLECYSRLAREWQPSHGL